MKRTGPTNIHLQSLISELQKKSIDEKSGIWKRIAYELERSTRKRRVVNLSRINRYANENEIVVVPGKVLSSGMIDRKITIAAWTFSTEAKAKIEQAGGKAINLNELIRTKAKPSEMRILG